MLDQVATSGPIPSEKFLLFFFINIEILICVDLNHGVSQLLPHHDAAIDIPKSKNKHRNKRKYGQTTQIVDLCGYLKILKLLVVFPGLPKVLVGCAG